MEFALNGEPRSMDGPLSVRSLLERCGLAGRRVAVAINAQVVPASRFDQVEVQAGDRVEVIQAVGGG
jgi:sulfur carrier protein